MDVLGAVVQQTVARECGDRAVCHVRIDGREMILD